MKSLDHTAVHTLETVATIIVPGFADLDQGGRLEFQDILDQALMVRPAAMRRQLMLFLKVLRFSPLFRFAKPLHRLSPERAFRVLLWFQESRVAKLRQGFWGLRTLVFMGFFGRPESWKEIGYTPNLDGKVLSDA